MENANFMQVVPNSHSFESLENILVLFQNIPEELTKEYLLIGLENTKKNGYEIRQLGEMINTESIFPSIENMIKFLSAPDVDIKLFVSIIQNTLINNIDLNCKIKMERTEIYKRINGERDYQDANWGSRRQMDGTPDEEKPVAEWINYIEYHISKAKEKVYHLDTEGATAELRKVAALAVRAMEIHGCPARQIEAGDGTKPTQLDSCCGDCECK